LRFPSALLAGLLVWAGNAAPARAQVPSGRDVVSPAAFASLEPVGRGGSFQLAVVLKIRDGFHINARQPSADYLIKTDLRTDGVAGFKIGDVSYPKGELHTFSFSKTPLNVYEGKLVLRMDVTALPDAPLGTQQIRMKLRYQACSNEVCLPPVTVEVDAPVTVSATANASHAAHPELFQSQR
jgi:thiol:disulfide interchange protein DsbD